MIIEVIGTTLRDVKQAEEYGVDRIELCQGMLESGLTPSYGLIETAVTSVKIPINVMVRPHNQSFEYNEDDIEMMIRDIEVIKSIGANGIVIGPLTSTNQIDQGVLQQLLDVADGLEITFHRAFDRVNDQMEALECLMQYKQISTILTSGGQEKAYHAVPNLTKLIDYTKNTHVTIMPGGGLQLDGLTTFVKMTKPKALHLGTGVRKNNSYTSPLDRGKIRKIKEMCD